MKPETEDWLQIADHDLGSAGTLLEDGFLQGSAFFCQQAIEKLVKAILTERDIQFPKVHDLVELADLGDLALSGEQELLLTRLSDHAVRSRYPGARYNESEVQKLFDETQGLYKWLRAKLS